MTDSRQRVQLIGKIDKQGLQLPPFNSWFDKELATYHPDPETLSELRKRLPEYELTLFMGTWCGDSKREVPRIYRILEEAGYDQDKLDVIAVSGERETYKQSPGGQQKGLNIHRVPTLIVSKNGREVGRFVERPVHSIEADLLAILEEEYTSRYNGVEEFNNWVEAMNVLPASFPVDMIPKEIRDNITSVYQLGTYSAVAHYAGEASKAMFAAKANCLLFPKEAYAFLGLALRHRGSGDHDSAKKALERALLLDPENKQALKLFKEWDSESAGSGF
jgi:thiol-disulfide isomerase/thioredoxin